MMLRKKIRKIFLAGIILYLSCTAPLMARAAQNSTATALAGQIRSQEEGLMEGVLVSAKRAGSTITTTVVSDPQGRYSFPRNRLEPGPYSLTVRATGYE